MDPISIATTAAGVVGVCGKVLEYVYMYAKSCQEVDHNVDVLAIEVEQLKGVLSSLATSFDPSLALESQTGYEGEHWRNVRRSMEDCNATLRNLEGVLEHINKEEHRKFIPRRSMKKYKLDMSQGEIDSSRRQIAAYRQTLQLSLQLITVASVLNNESLSTNLSSKLDSLTIEVHQVLTTLRRQPSVASESNLQNDPRIMFNLEECVNSAAKMVSSAATIVDARSHYGGSQMGSDWGDPLNDEQRRDVERWMQEAEIPEVRTLEDRPNMRIQIDPPQRGTLLSNSSTLAEEEVLPSNASAKFIHTLFETHSPILSPINYADSLNKRTSELSLLSDNKSDQDNSDLEDDVIQHLRRSASRANYAQANPILEKILEKSEKKYGKGYQWRDETLRMRSEACIKLGKWEEASKLLDEEFEGKSKLLRSLSSEFIRQGKRTDAERLLRREFDGRETVLTSLVTLYLQDRKWSDAQRCQLDLMKYETEPTIRLERTHFLAEICFKVKDYERAKEYCLKAIQGRQQIFGKRHHRFYQSVNLLAQILDATGDIVEAEAYKAQLALLPPGLHGTTPSHSMLTAECVEIEQLCHLDAKYAAEEIGKTFFKALLTDKKERNSVKENILKGSSLVSSTRGWSLIHTLAAYGRELAVQHLLEKGADLEAPSDHGTPLVVAALYGYEGTVKLLLEKGAQLEARNKYGGTPLSVATMNGYEGIVKLLIDRGANVEGKDKKGNTPLMCAARQDNWRIVEFFLWKGADVEARNKDGSTALMIVNNVHSSRATSVADLAGVSKTPTVALLQEAMSRKKNPWRGYRTS